MVEEIEVKYQVNSTKQELMNLIKKLNLKFIDCEEQKDEYWDTKDFRIINLKRGLRIRYSQGKINSIQFKSLFKKKDGTFFVEEVDLFKDNKLDLNLLKNILQFRLRIINKEITEQESPQETLKHLGLKVAVIFAKKRTVYKEKASKYHLLVDEIKELPVHIEIEARERKILNEICNGFEKSLKLVHAKQKGYLGILFNHKKEIVKEEEFEKKFQDDYEWNVQPSERELYEQINQT